MEARAEPIVAANLEPNLSKRATCSGWKPTSDIYTKNDLNFKIVSSSVNGGTTGSTISITTERSVSTSSTFDISVTDIIGLGASFATTEETSSSNTVQVPVAAGSTGEMAFTAKLHCQDGKSLRVEDH